jgi:hypothetical protein
MEKKNKKISCRISLFRSNTYLKSNNSAIQSVCRNYSSFYKTFSPNFQNFVRVLAVAVLILFTYQIFMLLNFNTNFPDDASSSGVLPDTLIQFRTRCGAGIKGLSSIRSHFPNLPVEFSKFSVDYGTEQVRPDTIVSPINTTLNTGAGTESESPPKINKKESENIFSSIGIILVGLGAIYVGTFS